METYPSTKRFALQRGFTMIEVLFAMVILSVGLVTLGSLAAQTMSGTTRSSWRTSIAGPLGIPMWLSPAEARPEA